MYANVERIGTMQCGVGESPVWHSGEQALYWTDIPGRTLWRWSQSTGQCDAWALPEMAGCIAMTSDGWALAMESGIYRVRQPQAGMALAPLERLATVEHARPDMRFNDGRCDRQGRFWTGTMVLDTSLGLPVGKLYRLDAAARRIDGVIDDLIVPNGLAFSPDGRTMYLSDSHASRQTVWAFDYDVESGTPHHRRVFIDMNAHPGRPDGAAVDAEGCYWICGNDAGLVHRFTPDGRLDRSLPIPTSKPAMCAFGGPGLDTLFVTSILIGDDPLSGATFAVRPGVTGLPEPALSV
ncbi:6-deoxy-6-sulfogluconolactonase [Ralstonia condita]|jgi:sugar lactone lactonase YvrE|uniref:6-deoxy-6-sulfogluconolactonase n=1 Tax=Ralstonia condita TaxID=3058600 RepID=A0ABM9J5C4_9RALS|nr:SMP-30/gluconolactonase/LRE family protein [Ralstonia sp. LMG 7141]CAJ0783137.1 6-deoxy-6-sulfogluconolactonase [Ralstonia sp. LMG 7141]